MNYAEIKTTDIANGEGVRVSLFVSGCRRRCKNCFNGVAWDFNYGHPFDAAVQERIFQSLAPDYIGGLSLLGGDPFEPENQRALVLFLKELRKRLPQKNIWCYTGYTYQEGGLAEPQANCEV
ncbi:MAG: anaerobic ribonucleoside-triphosphate reductase activating protein, partial [Clostridia bacterium]|nr:anaerobic ribonucleoside-triphosphate reductase activating protein [Clostridia bacterium]